MSNQLTKTKELKSLLRSEAMRNQFAAALPKHLSPERFGRVAMTALTRTPELAECSQESFMQCLLDLSAMGLEPDNQRAYLIPYGNVCTLIISYKGLVELMRRAGDISTIHADIICEYDEFAHNMGEIKEHTFDLRMPRGEMFAAYCQVTFKDGAKQSAIMSKEEIDKIRSKSKAGSSGPWKDHYNEMAKKTVVRRISKMITLSPEIMQSLENSEKTEFAEIRNVTPDTNATREALAAFGSKSEEVITEDTNEEGGAE